MTRFLILAFLLGTLSSHLKADIGLIDGATGQARVIYEDGANVYLKECPPNASAPLNRSCSSAEPTASLPSFVYVVGPYNVFPYQKTPEALALVRSELKNATEAAEAGSCGYEETLPKLRDTIYKLSKILSLPKDLSAEQKTLTYYAIQPDYLALLDPFTNGSRTLVLRGSDIKQDASLSGSLTNRIGQLYQKGEKPSFDDFQNWLGLEGFQTDTSHDVYSDDVFHLFPSTLFTKDIASLKYVFIGSDSLENAHHYLPVRELGWGRIDKTAELSESPANKNMTYRLESEERSTSYAIRKSTLANGQKVLVVYYEFSYSGSSTLYSWGVYSLPRAK